MYMQHFAAINMRGKSAEELEKLKDRSHEDKRPTEDLVDSGCVSVLLKFVIFLVYVSNYVVLGKT